ncbi:hypothetical protein AC578_8392 [Pseudocercospora eumusae]|uniref:Uncharacterized protein n=1 Tax=Pseudocercospora eumusae TaxID=321146 RepID=A0A139HRV1_9PEZI|nr:hypothetical protein AC578_8392 [Pseudocercospora eumusae]
MLLKTGVALLGACLITAARAETSTFLGVDTFDTTDTFDHDGDSCSTNKGCLAGCQKQKSPEYSKFVKATCVKGHCQCVVSTEKDNCYGICVANYKQNYPLAKVIAGCSDGQGGCYCDADCGKDPKCNKDADKDYKCKHK